MDWFFDDWDDDDENGEFNTLLETILLENNHYLIMRLYTERSTFKIICGYIFSKNKKEFLRMQLREIFEIAYYTLNIKLIPLRGFSYIFSVV